MPRDTEPRPTSITGSQEWQWEIMAALAPSAPGEARDLNVDNRLLDGPLDHGTLRAAFDAVMQRHDALRLVFRSVATDPALSIHSTGDAAVEFHDVSDRTTAEQGVLIDELVFRENRRSFDLVREFPWHAWVVQLGPDRHLLTLTFSHIVADGWSCSVFPRDLLHAYAALREGREPFGDVDDAPTFAELHASQLRRLGPRPERIDFWREQLDADPHDGDIEGTTPRIDGDVDLLDRCRTFFELPPAEQRQLRGAAWSNRTTPFVVLMSAYHLWLSLTTGKRHVVVSTATHARSGRERAAVFQCVCDPYVAVRLDDGAPVATAISSTHAAMSGALDHLMSYKSIGAAINRHFAQQRPWPDHHFADGNFFSAAPDQLDRSSVSRIPDMADGAAVAHPGTRPDRRTSQEVTATKLYLGGAKPRKHRPEIDAAQLPPDQLAAWISRGGPCMEVHASRLGGSLQYNPHLHDPTAMAHAVRQYLWVVGQLLHDGERSIGSLRHDFVLEHPEEER